MQDVIRHSINLKDPTARGSVISFILEENLKLKHLDHSWSWSFLQSEFETKEARNLFEKYRNRIRHSNFVLVLLLSIVHSIIQVTRACISQLEPRFSTVFAPVFCFGAAISLLIWSFNEKRFTKNRIIPIVTSSGTCIFLLLEEYGALLIDCLYSKACGAVRPRIGSATYLILLIYFLPLLKNRYVTIAFGLSVIGLEVLFSLLLLQQTFDKIGLDFGIYLFINVVGVMKQFVDEIAQRRSFLDLRSCIDSKLRLEIEKEKEEQLLLAIIPKHFSANLKQAISEELESVTSYSTSRQRSFAEMYIMSYSNVSILFADIVSFTKLTETLDVAQLITTLNELFGRFDEVSERNNCLRIKMIGDCYYCISGIPEISCSEDFLSDSDGGSNVGEEQSSQHALHCVNTGLEIIQIIQDVREKLRVPQLDMRIGVHSGHVHCGLLGLVKWQYDIWSRDVTIANMLEQTGLPGRVHISEVTKNFLGDALQSYPATERTSHPYIDSMDTFFVVTPLPRDQHDGRRRYSTAIGTQLRRGSMAPVQKRAEMLHKVTIEAPVYRTSATVSASVVEFRKLNSTVNAQLGEAIDSMALSKREQWLERTGIDPVFLRYYECNREPAFLKQVDPLFKYNLICALVLYVAIIFLAYYGFWPTENIGQIGLTSYSLAAGSALIMAFLIIVSYISWHGFFVRNVKAKSSEIESNTDTPDGFLTLISNKLEQASDSMQNNFWIRTSLFFIVCSCVLIWLTLSSLDAMEGLTDNQGNNQTLVTDFTTLNPQGTAVIHDAMEYTKSVVVIQPKVLTYSFALCLVVVSVFMRTHYMLKFIMKGIVLGLFTFFTCTRWRLEPRLLWESRFVHDPILQNWKSAYVDHILFLMFIFILLHLEDRQLEYFGRLDYLWKCKVIDEEEQAYTTEKVNRFLLLNILPAHVANMYINNKQTSDLFSERYGNVAVMFASIPNFTDFYYENDITEKGLRCLKMLNEIINDFDKLLFDNQFERIEKMKMVGSTFMAAAGLQTGRRTSVQSDGTDTDDPHLNVVLLVRFAIRMMEKLDKINKDSLQDFQLRIGISCGPVIAGIVGEQKPFYDIWGDTVNVSSRMDSTGVIGRIQVTEECAEILTREHFVCECRGKIYVKGKGYLTTYFVKTPYDKRAEVTHL